MFPRRDTRSLDIRRQSFDKLDRRRSADLCRSTRRYDEYWGAAEKSDTRLKCGDGIIHHVHSQMCILWSPVLRDMINLYPTPALLESTHGLAYLLAVDEDSHTWAAVLDMMYPVTNPPALDWELLERCLLLADKYDISCLLHRITARLLEPSMNFSIDPSQPNFALRWLSLSERLQLPEIAAHILEYLKFGLSELGSRPDAMAAVLAYAHEHLSKEQLLKLLHASCCMQAQRQQQQQGLVQASHHHHQQPQQHFVQGEHVRQLQTISAALQGWLGQANSSSSLGPSPQQQQRHSCCLPPVPLFNQQQALPQLGVSSSSSGTSSSAHDGSDAASADHGEADSKRTSQLASAAAADRTLNTEQQRLALCMSSGLFANADVAKRATVSAPAAAPAPVTLSHAAPVPTTKATVCPIPRFPTSQGSFAGGTALQQQQQQVSACGMQVDKCAPSFAFGMNAGNTIADWMCSQPDGMILT